MPNEWINYKITIQFIFTWIILNLFLYTYLYTNKTSLWVYLFSNGENYEIIKTSINIHSKLNKLLRIVLKFKNMKVNIQMFAIILKVLKTWFSLNLKNSIY